MLGDDLPGFNEAASLGYHIYCHSGNKKSVTYQKRFEHRPQCMNLTVYLTDDSSKLEAKLFAIYKMVVLTVGPISFPHKSIELFEDQILKCLPLEI